MRQVDRDVQLEAGVMPLAPLVERFAEDVHGQLVEQSVTFRDGHEVVG